MKKYIVFIIILVLLFSFDINTSYAMTTLSNNHQSIYSDWNTNNDWLIVEASGNSSGDAYIYASGTEMVRRAATFLLSYDNFRESYGTIFIPDSRDHIISSRVVSFHQNPSSVRYSDVYAFDNSSNSSLPDIVQYSLDALWSFSMSVYKLPLPSPWQLIRKSSGISVSIDSDLQGMKIKYNSSPQLQGCDYLIYINKVGNPGVTPDGSYWIDVDETAEAGLLVSYPYGYYGYNKNKINTSLLERDNIKRIILPDTVKHYVQVSDPRGNFFTREDLSHIPITHLLKNSKDKDEYLNLYSGTGWVSEGQIDLRLIADFRLGQ